MKKKAIEKIPYLGLKRVSRKQADYIGVTAIKIVGHEKHLFLEVYRNEKEFKKIPVVRIALTKKDFGTYIPDREEWSRQRAEINGELIWANGHYQPTEKAKKNLLQSPEDLERIKKFCNEKIWNENNWWEFVRRHQDRIVCEARRKTEHRKYERRMNALKDRQEHTEDLPEKLILDRADRILFGNDHYLYYKKRGAWAQIACSKCGGVKDVRWKAGESYESQFGIAEEPRENEMGTCPICGARGRYKCQGKVKRAMNKAQYLFLGQRYKEHGLVMRYIEVAKEWQLELIATERDVEMHGAYEQLSGVEIARTYFEPGKEPQTDYHKHNPYTGQDFWDDCNLNGMANIAIGKGLVLSETYNNIMGTMFEYCAMQEYTSQAGYINAINYLERYRQTPQIEMLVKLGLIKIVEELMQHHYGIVESTHAQRPDEFLGIRKEKVRQLIRAKGNVDVLKILQAEKRWHQSWTEEQVEHLAETGLGATDIGIALEHMTVQKLLNRIAHYAKCEYGTGCSMPMAALRHAATTYTDYLRMRKDLGYDLNNTVYQYPRDLAAEHNKMVMMINKEKADKQLREKSEQFPEIRKQYRSLRNRFLYEDDNYIIRPARSAEEIVMEGRLLHHCVGGDNYLNKHNTGKTFILLLRFKAEPEIPYITVEIDAKTERILQWYGEKDRKPDEKHMDKWLKGYLARLKAGTLHETAFTAIA